MVVEIYEDTIVPFDVETAKRYVYAHRNIFAKSVHRKVIYADTKLIIVKEVSIAPDGTEEVWFWGFSPEKRAIARELSDKDAIEALKQALL